jgi:hypothetical protein
MKKATLAIALAIATMSAAHAQNAPAPAEQKRLHFLVGMGLTAGGDKLATVTYQNLGEYDIKAGGLVMFTGGVDFRVTPEFSIQSTIGYHVDQAPARNGNVKFERYPIELLAYYHPAPKWRVGGGVRYVSSPKLSSSGVVQGLNVEFDNTVSGLVEAEYLISRHFGIKLRYVNEHYELKGYSGKIDANHAGVFGNFYF